MTTSPTLRKNPRDLDHGVFGRQLATTKHATAPIKSRRKGLGSLVCIAAVARQAAQPHHANGWTGRP
jgi:hypothetical protein